MDEGSVSHKPYAETQVELAISELVQLTSYVLERVMKGRSVRGSEEYQRMRQVYYECLLNASEIIELTQEDYKLPTEADNAVVKVQYLLNKLYKSKLYNIGSVEARVIPSG
jgi:hypothetical protein